MIPPFIGKRHFWSRQILNSYHNSKSILHTWGVSGFHTVSVADTSSVVEQITPSQFVPIPDSYRSQWPQDRHSLHTEWCYGPAVSSQPLSTSHCMGTRWPAWRSPSSPGIGQKIKGNATSCAQHDLYNLLPKDFIKFNEHKKLQKVTSSRKTVYKPSLLI